LRRSECSDVPLATDAPQQIIIRWGGNSTHILGTHVPVEEPSTASIADIRHSFDHLVSASAGLNHSAVMADMMRMAALFGGAFQSRL
jgi:hypothetical protein